MTHKEVFTKLHMAALTLAQSHKALQDIVEGLDMETGDDVILCLEVGQAFDHTRLELDYVKALHKRLGQDLGVIPKEGTP